MAKTSEKFVADKQPESQRGKSRFGEQPRSNRVVLPDRPPREIDNEIVSILLGGDPTSLGATIAVETTTPVAAAAAVPPPYTRVDTSPSLLDLRQDETPDVSDTPDTIREVVSPSRNRQTIESDTQTGISSVLEAPAKSLPSKEGVASTVLTRGTSRQDSSLPRANVVRSSRARSEISQAQDLPIFSFAEFTERWKHGMRKGQLKVCEVLYQKTYALGETECVTSFSELGRLSGLKMRQCFNIIAQLEALRFVERAKSDTSSNKKDQGSVIRFYLTPRN